MSNVIEVFPKYQIDKEGRVFFSFPKSPELYEAVASYSDGVELNAYEFAFRIKRVRADMLIRKNELTERGRQRARSDGNETFYF